MKILFYTQAQWAYGSIHYTLSKYAHERGHIFDVYDWTVGLDPDSFARLLRFYDYVVTSAAAPELSILTDVFNVPHDRIIAIAHGDWDFNLLIRENKAEEVRKLAGFGVVSESLYSSAIALHELIRKPKILNLGIDTKNFSADPPDSLEVVGYSGSFDRIGASGIDIKRGRLVQEAAQISNLKFRKFTNVAYQVMPQAYKTIDSLVVSSVQEGAGLPSMEAAAAGRLVISTGVGHFPRKALEGGGILAPTDERKFVEFVSKTLRYYADNPEAYREKCYSIREAAKMWDWKYCIDDWLEFFENPSIHS